MALLVLGINHRIAPVVLREQLAFTPGQLAPALEQASQLDHLHEVAILSTCNRTELYCQLNDTNPQAILNWLGDYKQLDPVQLVKYLYLHWDKAAVVHSMRVASGLDSQVLGEPQILGQCKVAYEQARQAGTLGSYLNRLFQKTFSTAKQVRSHTQIGQNPVSVAYAAVHLAKHIFTDLSQAKVMLIGAGQTIELITQYLSQQKITQMLVANRNLERGLTLAKRFNAQAINLHQVPEYLANVDIVIAATASPLPLLGKGAVESALKQRRYKPVFMVDLAVPRDIEAEVGELADVYLYNLDNLNDIIQQNLASRAEQAKQAEFIIQMAASHFMEQLDSLTVVDVLTAYRDKFHAIRQQQLDVAQRLLAKGEDPQQVLGYLARSLTNKFLHQPSIALKKAGAKSQHKKIALIEEIFALTSSQNTESEL
jgi:glutamyl-tRNA reductase